MKRFAATFRLLCLLALFALPTADATLINTTGARHYVVPVGGGGGEWADVYTTVAGADAQFTSAGRIVGIRGASEADYAVVVTAGNGGDVQIIENGSFDGAEDAIRLIPPDTCLPEPTCNETNNAQDVSFLGGLSLWNNNTRTVSQVNFGIMVYFGDRYIDLASGPKWVRWAISNAAETLNGEIAVFEGSINESGGGSSCTGRIFGVTYGTTQSYCEPDSVTGEATSPQGCFAADKPICVQTNATANHAANPPKLGQEWFYVEQIVTAPGHDVSWPDGRNRICFWTADGVLSEECLDIPWSWGGDYDPDVNLISGLQFVGGYWNVASISAHVDNFANYSHPRVAINMTLNAVMGPPPGFSNE